MKSELNVVRGLYAAIFSDLCALHPTITQELSRDLSRLHNADLSSGLPLYTITLPSMSKFLERSLDEGHLLNKRPPFLGAKSRADIRPQFLFGLFSLVFSSDGTLRVDADVSAIASLRQVFLAVKKLRIDCEERYVNDAISSFREIERSLPASRDLTWDHDDPTWDRPSGHPIWGDCYDGNGTNNMFDTDSVYRHHLDPDWSRFRSFAARIVSQFGLVDAYLLDPKHGPGAVSESTSGTKYDFRFWTRRLESVFPYDWFGAPSSEHVHSFVYREFPSRLLAVPKTQSGPRLIAAEPSAHQWMQGAIQRWLEDRIEVTPLRHSIDFRSQDASQRLAMEGSRTQAYATVDLSSASDRLSTRLVDYLFQGNRSLLECLHACRTRAVSIDSEKDLILLRKFSTQGSACTFPVQTIVFTLIAVWAVALTNGKMDTESTDSYFRQVRVFGDDIIIPTDAYEVLVSLLTTLLLKVNESKSFAHGKFREACGMDAYDGVDVTPAYFRQVYSPAATSLYSVIQCSNNFHKKGMWYTADYVLKTVPPQERIKIPVVDKDSGAFGIVSFSGGSTSHLPRRWNEKLHKEEVKVLSVAMQPKRIRGQGHGDLLQFFDQYKAHSLQIIDDDLETTPSTSLTNIPQYQVGQVFGLRSRKTTRWVGSEELPEAKGFQHIK